MNDTAEAAVVANDTVRTAIHGPRRKRDRADRPRIDGIINVAKPAGPTSHDVVAIVRRLSGVKRVGHGGTLDPFAMGVLPVFLGQATRMLEYHLAGEKGYRASVVFGARSSTDDIDGEMTPGEAPPPDRATVAAALAGFQGTIEQVPPDHSAVHVGGRRAYQVARDGDKPELTPRTVTIHAVDLVEWDDADPTRPVAVLDVRCGAGTYIRALARDVGEQLGCGAYLGALTRTASGAFRLEDAHPLDEVREELATGRIERLLLPPDAGLELPRLQLGGDELAALLRGQVVRPRRSLPPDLADGGVARVLDDSGRLVAMAHLRSGRLHPDKVFTPELT